MEYTEQEPLTTKEFVFKEGPYGEEHKVELCSSPMTHMSFTRDFATMVQLFISMMKDLDFPIRSGWLLNTILNGCE